MAHKNASGEDSEKTVLFDDYFTSILNAITESAFLMTPEGVVLAANRTVANRLGFKSGDDLKGKNILELHPPEVAEFRRKQVSEVVSTGESAQFEDVRDGRYIINSINPVLDSGGIVSSLAVFGIDITGRRQAEKGLQLERDRAQEYLDVASVILLVIDRNGIVTLINRKGLEILGLGQEKVLGKSWIDNFVPESKRASVERVFVSIMDGDPEEAEFYENPVIAANGQERIIAWHNTSLRDCDGSIKGMLSSGEDITERRKAEQKYQTLFREMNDGFALHEIICDKDGNPSDYRFLAVNPAFERMTGFKAEEMIGKTVLAVMPGTEPYWIEAYGKVALTGEPAFFENFSSEVGKHFLVSAFSPEPNQFACIFSDITDRKRSEEELAEHYLLLNMAGRTAKFGGWVVDLASNVCTWSDAVADIHEMPRGFSPLVEEGISFYHPDWQKRISEVFAECARKGIPYDEEMEIVTGSGKRVWVRTSGEAVRDGSGNIVKVQGSFQDISQSKKTEAAIRDSEHRFRTLANSGRAMIWTSGLDKKCDYFNQPWLDFTGSSLEQELGDGWVEGVHPDDLQLCVNTYITAFDTRKPFSMVYRLRRNDGEYRWILDDGMPRYGTEGVFLGYIGHCLDITEREVAEDALKETLERLRRVTGSVIQVIVMAVESRDPYTAGHQRRVGDLARSIASEMGIPYRDSEGIRVAGIIHDLGKISIPSEILSKPRKLNDTEFALVKEHSQKGYDILKNVDFDWPIAEMILQHHERLNGSGYPLGLNGEEITQGARIIAVADVVEAMASHRPYRPTLGLDAALEEIAQNRGTLYDTEVVDACLGLFREKGYRLVEG